MKSLTNPSSIRNDSERAPNKKVKKQKRKRSKSSSDEHKLQVKSLVSVPSCSIENNTNCVSNTDTIPTSNFNSVIHIKTKKKVKLKQSCCKPKNITNLAASSSFGSCPPQDQLEPNPDSPMLELSWNPHKKRRKMPSHQFEHSSDGKSKPTKIARASSSDDKTVNERDSVESDQIILRSDNDNSNDKLDIANKDDTVFENDTPEESLSLSKDLEGNEGIAKESPKPLLSKEESHQCGKNLHLKHKKTVCGAGYIRAIRYAPYMLGPFMVMRSVVPQLSNNMLPLEEFTYKPTFTWTKSDEKKADHLKLFGERMKKNVDFTPEEIEQDLKKKIENTANYFKHFCDGTLDEEAISDKEMNKVNFFMPYLPTHKELQLLEQLDFSEETEAADESQEGYLLQDEDEIDLRNDDAIVGEQENYYRGTFSDKECKKVLQNWQDFQIMHKFYDLRPLLSIRTCLLEGNAQNFKIHRLHYLSSAKQKQFISILGKGLNRNRVQILDHARGPLLKRTNCSPRLANEECTSRDLHCIDYFVRCYGVDFNAMEFILSMNRRDICKFLINHYRYMLCPIRVGKFSRVEVVRLISAVLHSVADKSTIQRTSLPGVFASPIQWGKVFEGVKTRMPMQCCLVFHRLVKQALQWRHYKKSCSEKALCWTSRHQLLLLKELCKSPALHLNSVDFYSISCLEEFAPFCDDFLKRMARDLICSKVPPQHRLNLDDSLDYLSRHVLPVLERKAADNDELVHTTYMENIRKLEGVIPSYLDKFIFEVFSTEPLYDEEVDDEELPNYSTSLFSNTRR